MGILSDFETHTTLTHRGTTLYNATFTLYNILYSAVCQLSTGSWILTFYAGLKKGAIWLSGTSRFSCWANNFQFSFAQWTTNEARYMYLPTRSLKLFRANKFESYLYQGQIFCECCISKPNSLNYEPCYFIVSRERQFHNFKFKKKYGAWKNL